VRSQRRFELFNLSTGSSPRKSVTQSSRRHDEESFDLTELPSSLHEIRQISADDIGGNTQFLNWEIQAIHPEMSDSQTTWRPAASKPPNAANTISSRLALVTMAV
jgi:hypothetical protein